MYLLFFTIYGLVIIFFVTQIAQAMVVRIYLARHGQDEDNAAGILNGHRNMPLTKLGEEQAQFVADKIKANKELRFDTIYSSPLKRAMRTAEILAGGAAGGEGQQRQEVKTMKKLIERDFGVMTGTPTNEITKRCPPESLLNTETITYFLNPEGAETFPDLLKRADSVISEIQQIHSSSKKKEEEDTKTFSSILLVTHGDFGKMLYAAYYKLNWEDVLKQFHFGNSEVLLLSEESSPEQAHVFTVAQYNS